MKVLKLVRFYLMTEVALQRRRRTGTRSAAKTEIFVRYMSEEEAEKRKQQKGWFPTSRMEGKQARQNQFHLKVRKGQVQVEEIL